MTDLLDNVILQETPTHYPHGTTTYTVNSWSISLWPRDEVVHSLDDFVHLKYLVSRNWSNLRTKLKANKQYTYEMLYSSHPTLLTAMPLQDNCGNCGQFTVLLLSYDFRLKQHCHYDYGDNRRQRLSLCQDRVIKYCYITHPKWRLIASATDCVIK